MNDNATCHQTLAVQDCLDSEGIQRLVWPARSPDLNPIENVWDALGRHVAGRNYPPTNKNTLIHALTEEWDKLPQQLLDNVVQSMVRRVECCITLHGGHIRNSSTSSYLGFGIRKTHFGTNTFHANSVIETCIRSAWNIRAVNQYGPVSINTMVNLLPRNVDNDKCVNVHIKRRKIHRTSNLMSLVTKRTIKAWLQYLVATPLYILYDFSIDDSFFNLNQSTSQVSQEEIRENITIEESFTAQQQTLLWNEEKYLSILLLQKRMCQEACYLRNMLRSSLFQQFAWVILATSGKELELHHSCSHK
ncbi:ATP-dependent DNA helicase [Trichonephila clavipes]|uniref:ATP-dependent DNA helicase n=1 Tax=Trichonephila clavipes TaxID=2585209 RepID=A0A8X6VSY6_TRICX|nr:ATP-dependent DNA helicase [Trichonephila clavipes]